MLPHSGFQLSCWGSIVWVHFLYRCAILWYTPKISISLSLLFSSAFSETSLLLPGQIQTAINVRKSAGQFGQCQTEARTTGMCGCRRISHRTLRQIQWKQFTLKLVATISLSSATIPVCMVWPISQQLIILQCQHKVDAFSASVVVNVDIVRGKNATSATARHLINPF